MTSRSLHSHGLAALAAALVVVACDSGREPSASAPRAVTLEPQAAWEGELELGPQARLDFRVEWPADTVRVRATLVSDVVGVDLHASPGEPSAEVEEAYLVADDTEGPATIELDRLGPEALAGTTWNLVVHWPFDEAARSGDHKLERAKVRLELECFRARVDGVLQPGKPIAGALDAASGGIASFSIVVPAQARELRLDLADVESDLDLYARAGGPVLAFDDSVAFAEHNWGRETLVITRDSTPPLVAGEWRVDVQDSLGPTRRLPFTLHASFDGVVPRELLALPRPWQPTGSSPIARAAAAVVELATPDSLGSGTLVSPDGWILTNAHVVGDDPEVEIVVALLVDPARPAQECLRAAVVRLDFERDLALLKIASGLYGQPLPAGFVLPALELGDAASLELGAPLWLVGYPTTGGTASRVTLTATRGIVAGFETADFGRLVKTDAEITQGNSGGAALDEQGRLVGVPSATVENGSGQIGYVHPIDALPRAWRKLFER